MTRSRRSSSSSDSDYGAPIRITKTQVLPIARSHSGRHRHHSPDTVVVNANNYLQLPGQARRARASSTSGQPAPVINNFYADDRSRSHSRHRERPDSSGSSDYHRSRSRRRHSGSHLPADVLVELTLAERDREDRDREKIRKQAVRDAKLKEEEDRLDRDRIILEARLKEEHDKKKADEKEKEIVDRYKQKEREKKEKEEQEKKEFDAKYEERVKLEFLAAGYSQSTIESIIKKKKEKERDNRQAIDMARPTFIRVHTKYLSSATLEHFNLPWEYDRVSTGKSPAGHRALTNEQQDPDFIIIKRYISHELQEDLFDHTKNLKNRKLLEAPKARRHSGLGETILSADGSNLFVVKKKPRSKSPARGYFIR